MYFHLVISYGYKSKSNLKHTNNKKRTENKETTINCELKKTSRKIQYENYQKIIIRDSQLHKSVAFRGSLPTKLLLYFV